METSINILLIMCMLVFSDLFSVDSGFARIEKVHKLSKKMSA